MIVLGLLLILFAVVAAAIALTAPSTAAQVVEITAVGVTVRASPLAMFLTGAVSVVLVVLGIALVSGGTRRKTRTRRELRLLRKDQAATTAETSAAAGAGSSRRERLHDGKGTDTARGNDGRSEQQPERHPESSPPS